MAKQEEDVYTRDIFGKNPVGRPRKFKLKSKKTPSQRAKIFRESRKFNMLSSMHDGRCDPNE